MVAKKRNYQPSPERIEVIRQEMVGNKFRTGKKLSPEHMEALRKANLGNTRGYVLRGRKLPEETKKKIKASWSPERKAKMSEQLRLSWIERKKRSATGYRGKRPKK
jgi:hypothetical protein